MKVKEIQVSVGQVVTPRSQYEPDRLTLTATVTTTTDEERDVGNLRHHATELAEKLIKTSRKLTGVAPFSGRKAKD